MTDQHSARFVEYSQLYGPSLPVHGSVWNRYLGPSLQSCQSQWLFMQGARNANGESFKVECGYVERKALPNAICGLHKGLHVLLMYHTMPLALLELFNRLLNDRRVMPDLGSVESCPPLNEDPFHYPIGLALFQGDITIRNLDEIADIFGPKCPIRRSMALELFHVAMTAIWHHEIAHALNGHVYYVQNALGLSALDEQQFKASQSTIAHDGLRCHFEAQADAGATFSVITGPLWLRSRFPNVLSSDQVPSLVRETRLRLLAMAFLSWYWMLMDVVAQDGDPNAVNTWTEHPSSLVRTLTFVIRPLAQASLVGEEIEWIIQDACVEIAQDLLRLSNEWPLFRPFGWLAQPNAIGELTAKYALDPETERTVTNTLNNYRFQKRSLGA